MYESYFNRFYTEARLESIAPVVGIAGNGGSRERRILNIADDDERTNDNKKAFGITLSYKCNTK